MRDFYTLIMGLLVHSWFKIVEFSQFLIISHFWHWKMPAKWKSSNFSKKRQYFWIICVELNLIFYRKEIWSILKALDYQILKESINLRLKCSFLSLVQVTPRVQVTRFTVPKIMMIWYIVPEIWHLTDVIVIFHFGLFFALSPP